MSYPDRISLTTFPPYPGLGVGQYIQARNGIHIGANVRMGPGVKLISSDHDVLDFERHVDAKPIVVGDNCWLGANCVLLPGVQLAEHVVVGAGSVVKESFDEADIVIAGVPARKVKKLKAYTGGLPRESFVIGNKRT